MPLLGFGCGSDELPGGPAPAPTASPGGSGGPATPSEPTAPGRCGEPLERSAATNFYEAARCLWEGPDAPQRGVHAGTIDRLRVAIARGHVQDASGAPLAGVRVRVLDHPEFGESVSREDGAYDLAVNGGSASSPSAALGRSGER